MARIIEVADLLATRLELLLRQFDDDSTVSREYVPEVTDDNFDAWISALTPMKGFVVPVTWRSELATRSEDQSDYSYSLIFVEKCTDAGRPSNEWMDERVNRVATVVEELSDARNALFDSGRQVWAQELGDVLVFDPDVYELNGAFWSATSITMREIA